MDYHVRHKNPFAKQNQVNEFRIHKRKLREMQPSFKLPETKTYKHLSVNPKRELLHLQEINKIQSDNRKMLNKVKEIKHRPSKTQMTKLDWEPTTDAPVHKYSLNKVRMGD